MALELRQLGNIGIEVQGIDASKPITQDERQQLLDLWNDYGLVVFRGQQLQPQQQIDFSRNFGELEMHPLAATTHREYPELFTLVNDPARTKFSTATYHGQTLIGRIDWHMDLHYTGVPNRGALMRCEVVASEGGLTGFGDRALAYDALDDSVKSLLRQLEVIYAFGVRREHMRFADLDGYEPGEGAAQKPADLGFPNFPDVAFPAVLTHPVSGRPILEICEQFLDRILAPHKAGLSHNEAIDLLQYLVEHTRKPEFHYFHHWREGDLLLWDNWRMMHCATGVKPGTDRVIHRTTIAGKKRFGRVLESS